MAAPIIFATGAGNGNTTPVACQGRLGVSVNGTHGGGTTLVRISLDDGTTWFTVPGGSITADTLLTVDVPFGAWLRLEISGGAGNSINSRGGLIDIQ